MEKGEGDQRGLKSSGGSLNNPGSHWDSGQETCLDLCTNVQVPRRSLRLTPRLLRSVRRPGTRRRRLSSEISARSTRSLTGEKKKKKKECSSTLDKLNEIVPTCFIAGAHGPTDSTTRNYRDVGPGRAGVDGRRGYNLKRRDGRSRHLLSKILISALCARPDSSSSPRNRIFRRACVSRVFSLLVFKMSRFIVSECGMYTSHLID